MKRYVIDESVCKKYNIDLNLMLTVLLLMTGKTYNESINELLEKEVLVKDEIIESKLYITNKWANIISEILLDSERGGNDESKKYDEKLLNLAINLMKIFPEGKKDGTKHYWRCNKMEVKQRLKKFFKIYGEYTDDEIINATKEYVSIHNGGDTTMRILKYFIIKDDVSDLASILENKGQNNVKNDIGELI